MSKKTKIITFLSPKGGTGKTLIAIHLATMVVRFGGRVLLVDADSATGGLSFYLDRSSILEHRRLSRRNCLIDTFIDWKQQKQEGAGLAEEWKLIPDVIVPMTLGTDALQAMQKDRKHQNDRKDNGSATIVFDIVFSATDGVRGEYFSGASDLESLTSFMELQLEALSRDEKYDYILIDSRGGHDYLGIAAAKQSSIVLMVYEPNTYAKDQLEKLLWAVQENDSQIRSLFICNKTIGKWDTRRGQELIDEQRQKKDQPGNNALVTNLDRNVFSIPLDPIAVAVYTESSHVDSLFSSSTFGFRLWQLANAVFLPEKEWLAEKTPNLTHESFKKFEEGMTKTKWAFYIFNTFKDLVDGYYMFVFLFTILLIVLVAHGISLGGEENLIARYRIFTLWIPGMMCFLIFISLSKLAHVIHLALSRSFNRGRAAQGLWSTVTKVLLPLITVGAGIFIGATVLPPPPLINPKVEQDLDDCREKFSENCLSAFEQQKKKKYESKIDKLQQEIQSKSASEKENDEKLKQLHSFQQEALANLLNGQLFVDAYVRIFERVEGSEERRREFSEWGKYAFRMGHFSWAKRFLEEVWNENARTEGGKQIEFDEGILFLAACYLREDDMPAADGLLSWAVSGEADSGMRHGCIEAQRIKHEESVLKSALKKDDWQFLRQRAENLFSRQEDCKL